MSVHLEQVSSVLRRAVQEMLVRGLNDPRIRGLVSVTKVEVTPDISQAAVFISVLPHNYEQTTLHGLEAATGHIQRHLAKSLPFKRLPRLVWKLDDSLKRHAEMMETIQHVAENSQPLNEPLGGDDEKRNHESNSGGSPW
ncbi:MAG TPA: 30S ribosome-binding factor RbfA [Phycisphaerales bacterium]|nr:30S ribosome-binding factor RbfA [Phycisphaerales bacterium]